MARSGVTALSFAVLLALFEIGSCIRCYQCNSQQDITCMDPYTGNANRAVDCGTQDASNFNRNYLSVILPSSDLIPGAPKYCAKIVLQTGTTIRTCLDGNPLAPNKTCVDLDRLAKDHPTDTSRQLKHCSVCETKELCNGAGSITASLPVAFVALIASYLYYKQ